MDRDLYIKSPIRLIFFDGEAVVFHLDSGETHHFGKDASLILSIINGSETAVSKQALQRKLLDNLDGDFDEQTLETVLGALQNLQII